MIVLVLLLICQFPLYLMFHESYLLLALYSLLQPIFILRNLKSWLAMVLFLYLENSLVLFSWLFTNDLLTFLLRLGKISDSLYQQLLPISLIGQQLLLLLLILIAEKMDQKFNIFHAILQLQKSYKMPAILLTILFFALEIFKRVAVYLGSYIDFYYISFLLATLSIILCSIAYFYSHYYQQQVKKNVLYQQYNKEMEKITMADEFRHDYQNIMLSLMGYIEKGDLDKALTFISSVEDYSQNLLEFDEYDQVNHLTIPAVQGLLIHFIEACEEKNIQLKISIPQMIQESDISIQLIDFIRCLSVVLDYSVDVHDNHDEEAFFLSLKKEDSQLYFELRNTEEQQLATIQNTNYSIHDKKQLKKYGLYTIESILKQYKKTSFSFYTYQQKFLIEIQL
ncbi:hypothetical protein RV12_GL002755 [Enterococcus quebecensis]|nr:hypothetical protein RV12_GL002755 [Enterococcus quebecensis]